VTLLELAVRVAAHPAGSVQEDEQSLHVRPGRQSGTTAGDALQQMDKDAAASTTTMRRHIQPLTGIRGLAACVVAIFHMNFWVDTGQWHGSPGLLLGTVFRVGYLGVDLFFALSGYVIAHAYLEQFRRPDLTTYGRFLGRRVARVWPMHALCLLLFLGGPRCRDAGTVAANLVMVHAWGFLDGTTCNDPSWSISCEFFTYLIFPVFAWLLLAPERGPPLALLGIAGLSMLSWLHPGHTLNATAHYGTVRALCGFAIGASLCRIFAHSRPRLAFDALGFASLAGMVGLSTMGAADLYVVALAGPLVVSVALCNGPLKRCLSFAPVVWLGEISYSVYLLHHFIIDWFKDVGGEITTPWRTALALAVICAVASLTYVWIERPARRAAMRMVDGLIPGESDGVTQP
jgi:peptidoglycan/LPS O-acetylase OafA/YrhL